MATLDGFRGISDKMLWKKDAMDQLTQFETLAARLGVGLEVVGSHTSKSISLPVVKLIVNRDTFLLRDNFNDVNLCVLSSNCVSLLLEDFFKGVCEPLGWDWYLSQIDKCRGYSWEYFSDEEMDDPLVLCVTKPHKHGGNMMDWSVRPEEKARWLKRMVDPSWYCHDWSKGTICWDGEFGPGAKLFVQQHPFAEGISKLVSEVALKPYFPGAKMFGLAVRDIEAAETIIRNVVSRKEE